MSKSGAFGKRVSQRTRAQLAFGAAVVLLVLSAIASYNTAVRLRTAQRWVEHTRDVQSALSDFESMGTRAARARARFIDTGENAFLEEYQAAADDIPKKSKAIEELTADNATQFDLRNNLAQAHESQTGPDEHVGSAQTKSFA